MPPRGKPVPKGTHPSSAPTGSHIIVIGNCRLDVPDALGYELSHEGFSTEIQDIGTFKVYEAVTRIITSPVGLSFTLLNPKNADGPGKQLLQDVLHLYNVELPAMSFAANTGKESRFLESCIMDGKYCTLILRKNDPGSAANELVGAVTFQILPPSTQQAEIPLAAVRHAHQRKGYGALMYRELQRRLVDVGVTSVFCWGDIESEAFWSKQGFVKVAEVDGRGKPRKLPIKGDLKKAMSIPGSATLMISYLDSGISPTTVSVPRENLKRCEESSLRQVDKSFTDSPFRSDRSVNAFETKNTSSPTNMVTTPQPAGEAKSNLATTPQETVGKSPQPSTVGLQKCISSITPLNMEDKLLGVAPEISCRAGSPGIVAKPLGPVTDPLPIVPLSVPDSEPLDPSDIPARGVPVTDITNTLPSTKSPGPLERSTYVRRQQTSASSTSVNRIPNLMIPTSSDKENNLVVDVDRAASSEEGKLSAFLGPRTKSSQRKNSTSTDTEEATGGDQVDLPCPATSEQKEKFGPVKRTKASPSATEGMSKQAAEASPAQNTSASDTPSEKGDKTAEKDHKNPDDETVTKVPPRSLLPRTTSGAAGSKTGVKRDRPVKLAGTRKKQRKSDATSSRGLDRNQSCPEGDIDESVQNLEQKDAGGLAEIINKLVPKHGDAISDSNAHQKSEVEDTSGSDCLDSSFRRHVQVMNKTSAELNQNPQNESVTSARKVPEAATIACAESNQLEKPKYVIMFMNMADENKKRQLIKHVEKLGGLVTCEGRKCTHVVTMEVRRTLNFCVAVSSGAWILSPEWLKASVKQKTFVVEEPYILRDKKFEARYNISLKDVIPKAQQMPNLLLHGLYIYPTPHVHPPVDTISEIMKAAGGQVLATFGEAVQLEKKSVGIVVACEEDMEQAMAASKAGLRTYNSDWLLTCIVKQELDFSVPQFTESL